MKLENDKAFAPFEETVSWTADAAPHRRGTFRAVVLQGESQSQSAGPTLDGFAADPWSVFVALDCALVLDMNIGDTLELTDRRTGRGAAPVLTVQQITRTTRDYVIRATANERAPGI